MAFYRWFYYASEMSHDQTSKYSVYIYNLAKSRNYFEAYEEDYLLTRKKIPLTQDRMEKSEKDYKDMYELNIAGKKELFRVYF